MQERAVKNSRIAVIGAGPAGLMAAEIIAAAGISVDVYEAMPSAGRKFLMAGKGGLNITHSEPFDRFRTRYSAGASALAPFLDAFTPSDIRTWIHDLGISTFVGTSGRIFPLEMKAAPLLRAWLRRLRVQGVRLHVRHRWHGWTADGALRFATPTGEALHHADVVVLALGGASWPQLGSDGAWTTVLMERGVQVTPLMPSNCGFDVGWSEHMRERFAGAPVKPVAINGRKGEFIVTATGVEGGLIYALSAAARAEIEASGVSVLHADLRPDRSAEEIQAALARPRGRASFATYLRKAAGLEGVKAALVRELVPEGDRTDAARLARAIKMLPIPLRAPRPVAEAISSAGGVSFAALDANLMIRAHAGVFVAGEMLDWDAPTGGYLLTASLATGRAAGAGVLKWLAANET